MSRWPHRRLSDLARLVGGSTPSRDNPDYWNGDIPWLSPAELPMPGEGIARVRSTRERITDKGLNSCAATLLPVGSVVFSSRATIGKIGITEVPLATNQGFVGFVPSRQISSKYLAYALLVHTEAISGLAGSTTFKEVTRGNLKDFEIPAPPLTEQEGIVRILDEAEALRLLRAQADQRTGNLQSSLFHDMFGAPPPDWPREFLGNLGSLDRGRSKHRPRDEPSLFGGPYPFIQTGDVANSSGQITRYTQTYSELGLAQSKLWPAGTLCITIAANIARTGVLGFDACFPDSVVGFTPGDRVTVEFVQAWLDTLQGQLEEEAPQAAQKNINLKTLRELQVAVPPLERQRTFTGRLSEIRALEAAQDGSRKRLDDLLQSLLHRAFQGEL